MLFSVLSNRIGIIAALFVQSLVFSAYHFFPFQNSVLLFIMGIFWGLGYLWSRSLLTPVLAHLLLNGLAAVGMLIQFIRTG